MFSRPSSAASRISSSAWEPELPQTVPLYMAFIGARGGGGGSVVGGLVVVERRVVGGGGQSGLQIGRAVAVGLFGLQTSTMRVAAVTSRAIASRSCRPSASRGTVIARAPPAAARCGYIENDGQA